MQHQVHLRKLVYSADQVWTSSNSLLPTNSLYTELQGKEGLSTSQPNSLLEGSKVRHLASSIDSMPRMHKSVPKTPQRVQMWFITHHSVPKFLEHSWRPRRLTLRRQGNLLQPRRSQSRGTWSKPSSRVGTDPKVIENQPNLHTCSIERVGQ